MSHQSKTPDLKSKDLQSKDWQSKNFQPKDLQKGMKPLAPPQARISAVTDDYHGEKISDPYRWLEDGGAPETRQFVEEENAYTHSVLKEIPGRDELRKRIESLLTIGRVGAPRIGGSRYFYERRDGRQNQAVVYVREGRDGKDRALIDVNAFLADGTHALGW